MMIMPVNSPHRQGSTWETNTDTARVTLPRKILQNGDLARRRGTCFCIDFFDFFPVRTTNFSSFWMFKLIVESKTQALPENGKGPGWMDDTGAYGFFVPLMIPMYHSRKGVHYGDANVFFCIFPIFTCSEKKLHANTLLVHFQAT